MIPVTITECGKKQIVKRINGRDNVRNQLACLGCIIGSEVTLLSNCGDCVMVSINDSRVALDKNIASRIIV